MAWDDDEDKTIYIVVVNHEEQYSIWPEYKEIPKGWRAVGKIGPKAECLAYIEEVWTDIRPLSLRKHMEEMRKTARRNMADLKAMRLQNTNNQTHASGSASILSACRDYIRHDGETPADD
jgi:MbtH protein